MTRLNQTVPVATVGLVCVPGVALFIAWGVGIALTSLTGLQWLGWSIGIPLGLILITGAWKWLPKRR